MSKPQIVLIPGAWHTPVAFTDITARLQSHGYTVHSRQLASVGNPNPPQDLSQDIAILREVVLEAIGDGNDVVVVPHSWSGVVAGSGLVGLGKKQREANGEKGGVIRGAYMCAFIVPEGVSLMDALQGQIPDWWYVDQNGHSIVKDPSVFYTDLPSSEVEKWAKELKTHSFGTKKAKSTAASWKEIPTWYLLCEDDKAIPKEAQEAMTQGVKDGGGEIEVTRIKSDHSPFLSHPEEVVKWIRKAAGEEL